MPLIQKTSSLPPIRPKQVTWWELKALDLTWLDWRWVDDVLTVWVYEVGWLQCALQQSELSHEELRVALEEHWIAAHYADLAYFAVNLCGKGKHDP